MSMKGSLFALTAAIAMSGQMPSLYGSPEPSRQPEPNQRRRKKEPTLPERIEKFQELYEDYNNKQVELGRNKKFSVQGFDNIRAINQKNATKAMRKMFGECFNDPDLTMEKMEYRVEYYELNEELKAADTPKRRNEIKKRIHELTGMLNWRATATNDVEDTGLDFEPKYEPEDEEE